jgi:hypothetical protein
MPLITRRRAKRREVQIHRARSFPFALNITKLASGEWQVASMPAPEFSDTTIRCHACGDDFECSAEDQRRRFAVNHHNPHFLPQYCPDCSRAWHRKKNLLASYDAQVGVARDGRDLDAKRRVLALLGELDAAGYELTGRMIYTHSVLTLQLAAAARRVEDAAAAHSTTRNHRPLGR